MLPRPVFQVFSLVLVGACVVFFVYYASDGGEPFATIASTLGSRMLANLCALLAGLLLAIPPIVFLRSMTDMRPVAEDFASIKNLRLDDITREREKLETMRTGAPADRRRYHSMMAAVSSCALVVGGVALLGVFDAGDDVIPNFVIAIFIAGVIGVPYHAVRAFLSRPR